MRRIIKKVFIVIISIILICMAAYYVYPQVDTGKKLNVFERMWLGIDFDEEEIVEYALEQVFVVLPSLKRVNPDLLLPDNIHKTKITYIDARMSKEDVGRVNIKVDIDLYEPSDADPEYRAISAVLIPNPDHNRWNTNVVTGLLDYYELR